MKSKIIALAAAASLSLGVVGVATVETSFAAPSAAARNQAKAYPVVQRGSQGDAVEVLQRLLNANGAKLAVDGAFGDGTRGAVQAYQRSKGLTADGVVGPATWSRLLPVLKQGARGATVAALEQTLVDHGQRITVNGSFGPQTKAAVVAFQRSAGLTPDGVVGPLTWAAFLGRGSTDKPEPPTRPVPVRWVAMDQLKTGDGGNYSCGPTSVAMVLAAKGRTFPGYRGPNDYADAVANLRKVAGTTADGTGATGLQRALEQYGVTDQRTKDMGRTLEAVRNGKAAILNGYTKNLPWLGGHTGHYIVVTGYDAGSGKYHVLDPWKGRSVETTAEVLTAFGNSVGDPNGGSWREQHIVS